MWVRLDDMFPDHPKIVQAGRDAGWLHICGICYSGRYLTDGFVPAAQVVKLTDATNAEVLVERLVSAGVWEHVEGGYRIHDYLEYNPSRQQVLEERKRKAERQAAWRERRESTDPGTQPTVDATQDGLHDALQDPPVTPAPSPSPSPSPSLTTRGAQKTRAPQRTRDPNYLPNAETQAGILFAGPQTLRGPEDQLRAANWDIRPEDVRVACCRFLEASGLSPPADKMTRGDWYKELHRHVENYGPSALEALYREAVQHCRDDGLTLSRPGGLTKILPAIAAGTARGNSGGAHRYPDEPEYHVMSQQDWDNAEVG